MKEKLTKLVVNVVSLVIVINLFSGIHIDRWQTTVIAVIVLTLVNIFLRPVIIILTLPLNIFSLGLFTFVINGLMFYLVSELVPGFNVDGFLWAFFGSMLFGIANFMINIIFIPRKHTGQGVRFNYQKHDPNLQEKNREVIDVESEEDSPRIKDDNQKD